MRRSFDPHRAQRPRAAKLLAFEPLERRDVPAVIGVNAGAVIRPVSTGLLGVNLTWWDSNLNTAQTQQLVQAAGLTSFRFPGGSSSDDFHFNAGPSYNGQGTDTSMAQFIASVNGTGIVTLDYGSGSPQEAAAFLAYLNAPVGNTTAIGSGPEWNDSTNTWQTVDWKTAGYWASLRASTPLAQDDGLNFLRIGRAAPFGFHYFEVGNEEYGSWEIDHHTAQHDPATYVAFAKSFQTLAASIDPTISIGVDVGAPDSWTSSVLQQSVAQGFNPGFLSDHNYVQAPGSESDNGLLFNTVSQAGNIDNWSVRASQYQNLLTQYLGNNGKNVELLGTEFNSVYSNPGKQTTSLVNGLFVADSLGVLLQTSYNGAEVWALRNSYETGNNNSSSLYGWRQGGDYGLLGDPNGTAPSSGTYVAYPTYYAEQLASKIIQTGGQVIQVSSPDSNLDVFGVKEANGHIRLLVINKSATNAITDQFQFTGFQPSANITGWQYGIAQDNAQSQSPTGASSLAALSATLPLSGSTVTDTFPAYSMSVIDLTPSTSPPPVGPTVSSAKATPSPVTGVSTTLNAIATDPAGASTLTYSWLVTGSSPSGVTFSANGTNAAQTTTATFTKAGTYTFQVTVANPSGGTTTGTVSVTVNQTLTSVAISPGNATIASGGTQQFQAQAKDQFGAALTTQPTFTWSVSSGSGTISPSGLYTAPMLTGTTAANARIQATTGSTSAVANVTINPPPVVAPTSAVVTYTDTNDWGSGFNATIGLKNTGNSAINGWTLQFDSPLAIYVNAGATIASHVGNHYVMTNASTDATVAPGATIPISIGGSPGRAYTGPTNYVLNGTALAAPLPPAGTFGAKVTFHIETDWGAGFTDDVTITNTGTAPIAGWTLQFTFKPTITSLWNATLLSHVGTKYTFQDVGWNGIIAPGQSITFGFNATPGHLTTQPTGIVVNGVALGTNGPTVTKAVVVNSATKHPKPPAPHHSVKLPHKPKH